METNNDNKSQSSKEESSFKNILGYDSEQTDSQATKPGRDENGTTESGSSPSENSDYTDNENGTGFAKPQKDDWPDEDESVDHPGGPTEDR